MSLIWSTNIPARSTGYAVGWRTIQAVSVLAIVERWNEEHTHSVSDVTIPILVGKVEQLGKNQIVTESLKIIMHRGKIVRTM